MAIERTLAIVKPDATRKGVVGEAIRAAEEAGLTPVAIRRIHLTRAQAEGFYAVHRARPFFADLTAFMSEGPVVVMALEGPDAIATWRRLLGATDPGKAEEGTLRRRFGTNIQANGFHGSDGGETAAFEMGYFFAGLEIP
ncbi:MAG: nucleoside-diphosphate kinase [Acidobacteria bacterium]|jgi:nucleoside-diphosphate kinase|nr:nucleoside-diphosphate kinase [Acidobacteriota bacterium]